MSQNNFTILIVDNYHDDTTMLNDVLSNDYNLVHADNDKSAMDTALRCTASLFNKTVCPDLMITTWCMPTMTKVQWILLCGVHHR